MASSTLWKIVSYFRGGVAARSLQTQTPARAARRHAEHDLGAGRMSTESKTAPETHSFQAEVAELLRLMGHPVYSETDIFLRELVSNASDACDRLRYEAIAKPELMGDGAPLAILIAPDETAGTLTIA